jgi:beta-galactosidase
MLGLALALSALWLGPNPVAPPAEARLRFSMDPGWRFTQGDPAGAERPQFDDRAWRILDLPHDWSIEGVPAEDNPGGGRVGYFPTGIGWYRKSFRLPPGSADREVWLEFDGVYMNSDVWLNGVHLGRRPYGYISFRYDLTPHLRPGTNLIAVRVDNSKQPSSRWYSGSGIYRHTWLTLVDRVHVAPWGVWVTTPVADPSGSEVQVRTSLANHGGALSGAIVRQVIRDESGHEVARGDTTLAAPAGSDVSLSQTLRLESPKLWSVERPYRYRVRTEVIAGGRQGKILDRVTTAFGVRSIAYDADRGFLLNGVRVKMRGVNLHHEAGGLGAAVPEQVWASRLARLKAMGVNAIRTSHNPPAPEFLDLCDSLGLLVMAEAFDEWTIGKVDGGYHNYFAEWSEPDVTDFVRRDRNHPSIVLWSAGNEIGEQSRPDGAAVLTRLLAIFHREDPTRPVTTGNDNIVADGGPATLEFLNALDIVGYNYVDRWHERRELFAEQDRHDHPNWKMIGTESGTIFQSFDEHYSLGDDPRVPHPNYTSGMIQAERLWKWITLRDYFAGNFMWTGIDYLGESTWPFKGFPSGSLDIIGQPKDAFYLYQSLWSDRPVLHLFPHWNWPGREGQVIPVMVYTNCNSVELFLNGRSLGEKRLEFPAQGTSGGWNSYAQPVVRATTADLHLSWDVPYQKGVLKAAGKRRDGAVACNDQVSTTGEPAALRLVPERQTITTGDGDVALVAIEVVDAAGQVVPMANNSVQVDVRGATLLALDNADLQDLAPYRVSQRNAFNGRALAILRPQRTGPIQIRAKSSGLKEAVLSITVEPGPRVPAIPPAQ